MDALRNMPDSNDATDSERASDASKDATAAVTTGIVPPAASAVTPDTADVTDGPVGPVPYAPEGWTWERLMDEALAEARLAQAEGEVPVGAVVVDKAGRIIGRGHNRCLRDNDPSAHAEMVALRMAATTTANYRLGGTFLVVTLEPCLMCAGAIVHARVEGVVYGAEDPKAGAVTSCLEAFEQPFLNHRPWHMGGVRRRACTAILKDFFNGRRTD
ncbi:tRNA-specific adenosine deaminase [Desulfovibrio desulfuricans]|nr:tRNA-specific adenosine deaminase [Desulfovibrio desulfuricans]